MNPAPTTANLRRFTILDGIAVTVVLAMAFLAARSTWPAMFAVAQAIKPRLLLDSAYIHQYLLGQPFDERRLSSAAVLVGETLANSFEWVRYRASGMSFRPRGLLLNLIRRVLIVVSPVLVYFPFTLLLLRLVEPRPAWADLLRQPGCSACATIIAALFVAAWVEIAAGIPVSITSVAAVLALVWIVQAATGRWQAEPSWLDWSGRALGVGWLMAGAVAAL